METAKGIGYLIFICIGSVLFRYFQHIAFDYPTFHDMGLLIGLTVFLGLAGLFFRSRFPASGIKRFLVNGVFLALLALVFWMARSGLIYHMPLITHYSPMIYSLVLVNWFVVGLFGPLGELCAAQLYRENTNKPIY